MLDRFLGKIDAKAAEADYQAMEEAMKKAKQELLIGMGVSKIMEKKTSHLAVKEDENARNRVMAETGLNDRNTDRNLTMVREYRDREYMIRKGDTMSYYALSATCSLSVTLFFLVTLPTNVIIFPTILTTPLPSPSSS